MVYMNYNDDKHRGRLPEKPHRACHCSWPDVITDKQIDMRATVYK